MARDPRPYYQLRVLLHRSRGLLRFAQVLRGWWILGPFRRYAVRYYQRFGRTQPLQVDRRDLFPQLDMNRAVHALHERGYADGSKIPDEYVTEIVQYARDTKRLKYWNPHRQCEAVDRIARNEKLVEIARRYLGAEPILWLTQLKWSFGPESREERQALLANTSEPIQYDSDAFHYDTLDFRSLTVFIYLTDVDSRCGPHVVIENTHRTKSLSDICRIILSDAAAEQKFGDRIRVILGEKGTVLLEETSGFHKASRCQAARLMLSIDYVLQRSPPPERPVFS